MDSPPPRSPSPDDPFLEFSSPPPSQLLPLPPGIYTLLPLVDAADNVALPVQGPWDGISCKKRWEEWAAKASVASRFMPEEQEAQDSALADDDDEDEAPTTKPDAGTRKPTKQELDAEFLAPFFLALPPAPPGTPARRRSSGAASATRPSFSRLTPLDSSSSRPSTPAAFAPATSQTPTSVLSSQPIGFLRPSIVRALIDDNLSLLRMNCKPVWAFQPPIHYPADQIEPPRTPRRRSSVRRDSTGANGSRRPSMQEEFAGEGGVKLQEVLDGLRRVELGGRGGTGPWAVAFEEWVNEEGAEVRKEHMDRVVRGWKAKGMFEECLGGWRDEEYTIYAPSPPVPSKFPSASSDDDDSEPLSNPLPGSNEAFRMERCACSLFGVPTFGVHLTAYVGGNGKPLRFWIPRRAATKPTWPSYLDNTVAGGITAGDMPRHSIIRECWEEASLDPAWVAPRLRQAGVVTYHYRTDWGWLQPEVQYVYDLELPDPDNLADGEHKVIPTTNPADGEVESFELLSLEEVVQRMVAGEFKPNCALILLDFFMRHGLLTPESDTRFLEIAARLRKPLGLPGPA
ncbi:hypothetical protein NBRC10513v2_003294 [Rhodotorula toruloides]|uniref:BY PROTMAP: gi/472584522/gb/EMS22108.1/ thiamin pyrophosphokinase-related protein [Rhodosporidium toruloides NP11] gi/647399371/emb/CDR43997.1/ RHTO0S08e09120g1_1 [Rhodosporidium toruloides] n=2 Tax=Rhodotorula toruloides TaxID=5286 RepID=A0A0K3CBT5_RHOTO